jgi:hypothetical protein
MTDAELIAEIVPLLGQPWQDRAWYRDRYQATLVDEVPVIMRRKDVKRGVRFLPAVNNSEDVIVFDEKRANELIRELWASPYRQDIAFALAVAAREFVSEGVPLPPTLRDFVVSVLDGIGEGPRCTDGKLRYATSERNARIIEAAQHLRDAHRVGGRRARRLVVRALEKSGTYLSEDAVRKVLTRHS